LGHAEKGTHAQEHRALADAGSRADSGVAPARVALERDRTLDPLRVQRHIGGLELAAILVAQVCPGALPVIDRAVSRWDACAHWYGPSVLGLVFIAAGVEASGVEPPEGLDPATAIIWSAIAAVFVLLTTVANIFGPGLARKWFPQDDTMTELVRDSTRRTAKSLDRAIDSLGPMRATVDQIDRKIDRLVDLQGPKKSKRGQGNSDTV
jgi:hypothetical protein